jgi:thymidylate synthase (FAD)
LRTGDVKDLSPAEDCWLSHMAASEVFYRDMIAHGETPQIARSILPHALKVEIVVTYNLCQWRHFINMRISKRAHPQIRFIAGLILDFMWRKYPPIFEDTKWEFEHD